MNKTKKLNIVLTVFITIASAAMGFFIFKDSYLRLWECLQDLWHSMQFYFFEIIGARNTIKPTVVEYSEVIAWNIALPSEWNTLIYKVEAFFYMFANETTLLSFARVAVTKTAVIAKIMVIVLPLIISICMCIVSAYKRPNTKCNKDTIALKGWKWASRYTYQPIKNYVLQFLTYLKEHSSILVLWIFIWALNLNVVSIIIAFLAYYLYFSVSFQFATLYVQFCKLFIDLQVVLSKFPWWVLLIVAWFVFDRFRQNIAQERLQHFELKNRGFINALPIVSMSCGAMGKKKTTMVTDMALSQEVMFREKAFELLKKNDMKFPYFPWLAFEKDLQSCMRHRTVYNLATVKSWVNLKKERFEKHHDTQKQLYGYELFRYGSTYDDSLKVYNLFEVLSNYAQLYFIYVIQSSLLVSNYSIREDNLLFDRGNFPIWCSDFFPKTHSTESRHSHILDFDVLRLGKKVIEENIRTGSFEFGVVVISEVGKERGNNLELKEIKKKTNETNQKNDLFNSWLKMCRHSATVDNFPFIKVFTDEQRAESWGADARDLCDIVQIIGNGELQLALPFYTVGEMISEWMLNGFLRLYYKFRFIRGDNTLLVHFLKTISSLLNNRNLRLFNRFAYSLLYIEKERGTMDGKIEKKKYYLMNKKIYSQRFSTDCFSDYFNNMARQTNVGLSDYPEYVTERATVAELQQQNSYFISALYSNDEKSNTE